MPTLSILITLGILAFAGVTVKKYTNGVILFLALFPTYLIRTSILKIPSTFLELCFFVLCVGWIINYKKYLPSKNMLKKWCIALGIITIPLIITLFGTDANTLTALGLWRAYLLEPTLFFFILSTTLTTETLRAQGMKIVFLSTTVIALLGIAQYLTGVGIPIPWDIERRITSVFPFPNALGLFLAPTLSALLIGIFHVYKKYPQGAFLNRSLSITAISFITIAILLAKTEAAYIAIPGALAIILTCTSQMTTKKKLITGLVLACIALVGLTIPKVQEKILLRDYSGQVRLSQWQETWEMLKDHPLTGAGIGNYPTLMKEYHTHTEYEIFQYPHTLIFNIWVEYGLFGLITFFIGMCFIAYKISQQKNTTLTLMGSVALLTMVIHGLVDVPFLKNDLAMLTVWYLFLSTNQSPH